MVHLRKTEKFGSCSDLAAISKTLIDGRKVPKFSIEVQKFRDVFFFCEFPFLKNEKSRNVWTSIEVSKLVDFYCRVNVTCVWLCTGLSIFFTFTDAVHKSLLILFTHVKPAQ